MVIKKLMTLADYSGLLRLKKHVRSLKHAEKFYDCAVSGGEKICVKTSPKCI